MEAIDIDIVLDSGYIEHLIEDEWYSPFPQHAKAQRPDKAAAALLEGKEASFRLPSPTGQVFGIVGGLVLGDMGVRAGIVSEAMVIVVAVTAISSFAVVDREMGTVLRLIGLPVMLSTATRGGSNRFWKGG